MTRMTPFGRAWTAEEDARIARDWPNPAVPTADLVEAFGRTKFAIMQRAKVLGVRRVRPIDTEREQARRDAAILELITKAARVGGPSPTDAGMADATGVNIHEIPRVLDRLMARGALVRIKPSPKSRYFQVGEFRTALTKSGMPPKAPAGDAPKAPRKKGRPKSKPAMTEPAPAFIPPAKSAPVRDRAADQRAIEEAIAAGKVTRCPPAYSAAVEGARPLPVPVWNAAMSKATWVHKQLQARRRAAQRARKDG